MPLNQGVFSPPICFAHSSCRVRGVVYIPHRRWQDGDGEPLSSFRCGNDTSHQCFGCEIANTSILLPEGLIRFAFRRLSEKQKREPKTLRTFSNSADPNWSALRMMINTLCIKIGLKTLNAIRGDFRFYNRLIPSLWGCLRLRRKSMKINSQGWVLQLVLDVALKSPWNRRIVPRACARRRRSPPR